MNDYKTVDEYLANFSGETLKSLTKVRSIIKNAAPEAVELISYGIPTFKLSGKNLVHFAGYEAHIGFYPGSAPIAVFADKLGGYETSKGTVRFPLDKPIPYDLIKEITEFCVQQQSTSKKVN